MKQRVLECQITEDNWRGFPIITLPVDEIWQSVPAVEKLRGMPFKDSLSKDILTNGMRFPIMVVHTSYKDLQEAKRRYRKKICDIPSDRFWGQEDKDKRIYSVWGGSQRLTFARENKYTHIVATVLPTIQESISLQKEMRRPFPELYGKGKRS